MQMYLVILWSRRFGHPVCLLVSLFVCLSVAVLCFIFMSLSLSAKRYFLFVCLRHFFRVNIHTNSVLCEKYLKSRN